MTRKSWPGGPGYRADEGCCAGAEARERVDERAIQEGHVPLHEGCVF
jgi:hypothetical protein